MEEKSPEFRATGLFISGFQSIEKDTYIPIRPLTFLYGPNSAGKSSVLDAIGLLQNIANKEEDLVFSKVRRWARKDIDSDGKLSRWGELPIRLGVEFFVPANWKEFLSREVLAFNKNDFTNQSHIDWIDTLVGKKIQLDIGFPNHPLDPWPIRLAIDQSPVFECRLGEQDDGRANWWDSNGRDPYHEDYDEDSEIMVDGPLRMYHNHKFWNKNTTVASLVDFAKSNSEPDIALFVRENPNYIDLYDVMQRHFSGESNGSPFDFSVGNELYAAMRRRSESNPKNAVRVAKNRAAESAASSGKVSCLPLFKSSALDLGDTDELLVSLSAMCRGLLELGSKSLTNVQVSGSRQILKPGDMTFTAASPFESLSEGEADKFRSFFSFARHLAYEETKSKSLVYYQHSSQENYRLVNKWLLATLPSLRGHRLCVDAFLTSPVPRKKDVIANVPKFTYRLYLTDAQGRAHEFEDVGSGFSYLLPVLMALWNEPWSIVEQPELHLHPAAQCDVADVFIAAKNIGHAAVIESHSENLLLRLLRRIRETNDGSLKDKSLKVNPDDVAVMYFDPQSDGTTVVKRLRISRDGDFIDRWPAGFFEERTKELFGE